MSDIAPPISKIPGKQRPDICISFIENTCSLEWIAELAQHFAAYFEIAANITIFV